MLRGYQLPGGLSSFLLMNFKMDHSLYTSHSLAFSRSPCVCVCAVCVRVLLCVGQGQGGLRQHIKTVTGRSHLVFHFTRGELSSVRSPISFQPAVCCAGPAIITDTGEKPVKSKHFFDGA